MSGLRYRLVTLQEGLERVSSVVLSREEAAEMLGTEALLHRLGGWSVDVDLDAGEVRADSPRGVSRVVRIQAYDPFADTLSVHTESPEEGRREE